MISNQLMMRLLLNIFLLLTTLVLKMIKLLFEQMKIFLIVIDHL